jgi:prevent-host-death family protein
MVATWQASDARHRFPDVIDAAVNGDPQFVRRRDGKEVVVVSREYFEKTIPNLKTYLLTEGYADQENDPIDRAIDEVRSDDGPFLNPRAADLSA